jgi:hypothetical protein
MDLDVVLIANNDGYISYWRRGQWGVGTGCHTADNFFRTNSARQCIDLREADTQDVLRASRGLKLYEPDSWAQAFGSVPGVTIGPREATL